MVSCAVEIAVSMAWKLWGTPYIYAGNDPFRDDGLDCSGFVIYILKDTLLKFDGTPVLPRAGDWTAAQLYDQFSHLPATGVCKGCLLFYGRGDKIGHVMFAISDKHCIGAVNGDEYCLTVETAKKMKAYVDVRSIKYRPDLLAIVNPFLATE